MKQRYSSSTWAILAGLRFVLAAVVLISHLGEFRPTHFDLAPVAQLGARAAVLGFLLISGFSVGYSYVHNPKGYFSRRFLRIYPLYLFAVLAAWLLVMGIGEEFTLSGRSLHAGDWKAGLGNLLFLQGFTVWSLGYNGPLWTLGVEVFFYALAPLLSRVNVQVLAGIILLSMLAFVRFAYPWMYGYVAFRYCWPWLIGFIIATRSHNRLVPLMLFGGLLVTLKNKSDTGEPLSVLTYSVAAGCILYLNHYRVAISTTIQRLLNLLGELSYPLYLFHYPIYIFAYRYLNIRNTWAFLALVLFSSIVLNQVLDHWLKRVFWKPAVAWLAQKYRRLSFA